MKLTTLILIASILLVVGLSVAIGIQYVQNKKLLSDNDLVQSDLNLLSATSAATPATYITGMDDIQRQLGDSQGTVTKLQRLAQERAKRDSDFETATGVTLSQLEQLIIGGTSGDSETDTAIGWLTEFGRRHGSPDASQRAGIPSYPQKD